MNVYTVPAQEVALIHPPDNSLRLQGTTPVERPEDADVIVFPLTLQHIRDRETMDRSKIARDFEDRMVYLDVSDNEWAYGTRAMLIRCNTRDWMVQKDRNTIACAWPVAQPDLMENANKPWTFDFDIGFHGWVTSHVTRKLSVESLYGAPGLTRDFMTRTTFYGYTHRDYPEQAALQRAGFLQSMNRCRFQLCPQSIAGVAPYRMLETFASGRVAVVFIDESFVWPHAGKYDPTEFCFVRKALDAPHAGEIVQEIKAKTPDDKLRAMGARASEVFLRYMDNRRWPELHAEMVEERARALGLIRGEPGARGDLR